MKKLCILLCILLTVLFSGCAQQPPAASETPSTTTASATTVTVAANPDESGTGGYNSLTYWYNEESGIYSMFSDYVEITNPEELKTWNQTTLGKRDWNKCTIFNFVRDFQISKEKFVELNLSYGEEFRAFTDAQIDIIYSDLATFNREFANPYAIVKGEAIYPPMWLIEHSVEDYTSAGLTADEVNTAIQKCANDHLLTVQQQEILTEKCKQFAN